MTDEKDSDENVRDYHLAPKQRKRINDKEALADASESPGEFLRNIQKNKVEKIPDRINRLFSDINLLAKADFFTKDWESEIWDRVDLSNDNWEEWDWEPHLQKMFYRNVDRFLGQQRQLNESKEELHQFNGPIDFGLEIGIMLRRLCNSYISTDEQYDLLVGIFAGLIQPGQDTHNSEFGSIQEFKQKLDSWGNRDVKIKQDRHSLLNTFQNHEQIIRESTSEIDSLTMSDPLENYLLEEFDYPENKQTKEGRKHKRSEIKNQVNELIENTNIDRIENLREDIQRNISDIDESLGEGKKLLSEVYRYSSFTYADIEYSGKNVEQIVNILAGDHEFSDTKKFNEWTQNPLIQEISGRSDITEWRTTEFGTLIGYLIDNGKSPGWVHNYVLEKEYLTTEDEQRIEQALSELDL